jgi:hypothetical protein
MAIPLPTNFNIKTQSPIDSRYLTGTYSQLSNIENQYSGMQVYATGDKKLYYLKENNTWSTVLTDKVDINEITENFVFESGWNSKLLKINTAILITGVVPSGLPLGYNVAFAQMGNGALYITGSGLYPNQVKINQRNSFNKTAGKFAVASLLNYYTDQYLLYGDLA